jgi:phosphoglycolate phosphatase
VLPIARALLFDLDGTLVDTAPSIAQSLNETLRLFGRPPLTVDIVTGMIGHGAPKLLQAALDRTGGGTADVIDRAVADYAERVAGAVLGPADVYPGVPDTLAALRDAGWRLAVVTNKPDRAAGTALARTNLAGFFPLVISGESPHGRKPSGRPLLAAVAALGVHPVRSAMIGDSINDVRAARDAGIRAVAVSYGYPLVPLDRLGADALIDRFDRLPAALAAVMGAPAANG